MSQASSPTRRTVLSYIFLSPDDSRLRAGWRLLLHTILLGIVSATLLLLTLFIPGITLGEIIETNPVILATELVSILLATWLARRFLDRRSFRSLGFELSPKSLADLLVGFAIPAVMMSMIFIAEIALGWTTFEGWAWQEGSWRTVITGVASGLFAFILVGFGEEILSRGYHLQNLYDGLNPGWALLISSGLFALLHTANPNSSWVATLGLFLAGYFLAYGWVRTRQLWLSIGLHIGWNFFEGTIFGFPVSGLTTYRLMHHKTTGPDIMTGGAFGPEAGLIVLPAMALGVLLIFVYTTKVRPSIH